MKRILKPLPYLLATTVLCLVVSCTCGSHTHLGIPLRYDYLVSVPPWSKINHATAGQAIQKWTRPENLPVGLPKLLFGATGLPLDPAKGFNINQHGAGGNAFIVSMTKDQAKVLSEDFSFAHPMKRNKGSRVELIVSRIQCYKLESFGNPHALSDGEPGHVHTLGVGPTTNIEWAADSVFEVGNPSKLAVDQKRTPVLYVVDTGIKPFAGTKAVSKLSTQFVNVKLRQGRIADGLGAVWPDPELDPSTDLWGKGVDQLLDLSGSFPLYTPTGTSPNCLNPQEDPSGHGTRVASTALGATVGVLGKMTKLDNTSPLDVEVESICIYSGNPTGDPTYTPPPPTSTQVVASGIYKAVDAHLARKAALGSNPPSVLLFTSRSTSGFDAAVETALWWAWTKGMICVVSGGNEPGSSSSTAMHSPNAMWYSGSGTFGTPQSTSPARWDWNKLNDPTGAFWPNPTAGNPSEPVPMPDKCSLIIVGGSNLAYAANPNPNWGGTDDFRKTSTGAFDSSRGPDIDILAPSKAVPSAIAGSNSTSNANGTSLATGFVAGAALAYAACATNFGDNAPEDFRNWLTPSTGPGKGCKISTSPTAWSTGTYRHSCYGEGTMGAAYNSRVPTLHIRTLQTFP